MGRIIGGTTPDGGHPYTLYIPSRARGIGLVVADIG